MAVKSEIRLSTSSRMRLNRTPGSFRRSFQRGMKKALFYGESQVKEKGLSGIGPNSLRVRTGYLRRSFKSKVLRSHGGTFKGLIFSDTVYANIHETGGVIRGRPFLIFNVGGRWVKTTQVTIPQKEYMSKAIIDSSNKMKNIIWKSINKGF